MNTYLVPLENLIAWVRDAWGASLFPLLIGGALLVLLLILAIDRDNDGDRDAAARRGTPRNRAPSGPPPADQAPPAARVSSPVPKSTTPRAPLPAAARAQAPAADWEPAPQATAEPEPVAVLVVDDSAVVRLKLRRLLEGAGYTVEVARNGLEALDLLPKAFYSVLVTDLEMPEMSGLELIASVHGSLETEDLPIIAITGHEELQSRVHDYAGLYGLFRKPWNDRDLLKRIEALAPLRRKADHPLPLPSLPLASVPLPTPAPVLPAASPLAGP